MFAEKQFYTLIIAPARGSRLYKIIFHHQHLYALAASTIMGLLIVTAAVIWLVKHAALLVSYHRIQGENRVLKEEFHTTLGQLRSRLKSIEEQSQQLAEMAKGMGMQIEVPSLDLRETAAGTGGPAELQSFAAELERTAENLRKLQMNFTAERIDSTPTGWPTEGRMTAGFGARRSPFGGGVEFHSGQDISAPYGQAVRSTANGVVVFASYRSGYGNLVVINHGEGITTFYGHLSSIFMRVGDHVDRGMEIGAVGSSGRSSGAHVHYEIRLEDRPIDPSRYTGN